MSAYRRINRGSLSLQSALSNCVSSTETVLTNTNEHPALNSVGNGNDGLIKSGQQMAMKYDELQAHASKFEHELAVNGNGLTNYPAQPKHIRFPDVPYCSELVNELMIFLYTMIATAIQFLHSRPQMTMFRVDNK